MAAQTTKTEDSHEIWIPLQYRKLVEDLRNLKRDGDNPNRMTKRQKRQLWKSLLRNKHWKLTKYGHQTKINKKGYYKRFRAHSSANRLTMSFKFVPQTK